MLSVRKVKTKSGSTAVQVVRYLGHKSKIIKHIGSGKDTDEVIALIQKAQEWIANQTKQLELFPTNYKRVLFVDTGESV